VQLFWRDEICGFNRRNCVIQAEILISGCICFAFAT
jgi:hypothetical protein